MNQRLIEEAGKMTVLFVYLTLFLGGFATYKRIVLAEEGIGYFEYGYAIVEALLLAKVILLGDMLHVGRRFREGPLILSTLYQTVTTTLFAMAFSVGEHFLDGLFHGKDMDELVRAILSSGKNEILARTVVMFVAFIPMFAIWEMGSVIGEHRLFDLFFKSRPEGPVTVTRGSTVC